MQAKWNEIALTEKESSVIKAVRLVEPRIERIAFLGGGQKTRVVVKLEGMDGPVPIGSLGEGVGRLFALALAMVGAEGGFLLIDEIESGLYYRVQEQIWDFLHKASKALNVQVIATTHSRDCVEAFGDVFAGEGSEDGILIRLSRKPGEEVTPVHYSPSEVATALEFAIEVR
jgi:AAA15 family ATPase/GTPase